MFYIFNDDRRKSLELPATFETNGWKLERGSSVARQNADEKKKNAYTLKQR